MTLLSSFILVHHHSSTHVSARCWQHITMGWLRLVSSKLYVSFAEYRLLYRALLPKRPTILRSLLILATPYWIIDAWRIWIKPHSYVHCNTLQHTATHCNTLQHTATHCNTLQHAASRLIHMCSITHIYFVSAQYYRLVTTKYYALQHTAKYCNTLQHTAAHCNTVQHTAPLCNESELSLI